MLFVYFIVLVIVERC